MTSQLIASHPARVLSPQRYRSPVFVRYLTALVLAGTLPVVFLYLRFVAQNILATRWAQAELIDGVLADCHRTFFGAAFPFVFILLTLAYSHPRLQRAECHALLLSALFLLGGCISSAAFIRF